MSYKERLSHGMDVKPCEQNLSLTPARCHTMITHVFGGQFGGNTVAFIFEEWRLNSTFLIIFQSSSILKQSYVYKWSVGRSAFGSGLV